MNYLVLNRFVLEKEKQPHKDRYHKEQISQIPD